MAEKRSRRVGDAQSALSLPEDVRRPCPAMTVLGQQEVTIEGHGGILACGTDVVCVRMGKQSVTVTGSRLVIDYYHKEELKITGCIQQLSWKAAE